MDQGRNRESMSTVHRHTRHQRTRHVASWGVRPQMRPGPSKEIDCSVDIDDHEHRVLHHLTKIAKGKHHLATYDLVAFASRTTQASACDCRDALERLADQHGLVERVGDGVVKVLERVFEGKLIVGCGCKGQRGMHANNRPAPKHEHAPGCPLYGCDADGFDEKSGQERTLGLALRLDKSVDSEPSAAPTGNAGPSGAPAGSEESSELEALKPLALGFKPDELMARDLAFESDSPRRESGSQKGPRTKRQPRPSDVESWSNLALAQYFADSSKAKAWGKSMKPTNEPALAKAIKGWRNDGDSATEIKKAIDLFFRDVNSGSDVRQALWQDFIGKYHWSVANVRKGTDRLQGEDIRYDREAWLQ